LKVMKRILIIVAIMALFIMIVPVTGCSTQTKIGDIQSNPSQFTGKEVAIKGTVGDTFWLAVLKKWLIR
jgi:hypothetical protein